MHRLPRYFDMQGMRVSNMIRSKSHKIQNNILNKVPVIKPKNQDIIPSPLRLTQLNTQDTCYSDDDINKKNKAISNIRLPKGKFGTNTSTSKPNPLNLLEDNEEEIQQKKIQKKSNSQMINHKSILSCLQNKK